MPSVGGQLRIFISEAESPLAASSTNGPSSLSSELGQLASLLGALGGGPEDYDDDASSTRILGGSSEPHNFLVLRFMPIQIREESAPCTADVSKHCNDLAKSGVNPFHVRMCLQGILESTSLSERCTSALADDPSVVEMCYSDIRKHCSSVEPGSSKIHSCLSKIGPQMSQSCGSYFSKINFPISQAPSVVEQTGSPDYRSLLDRLTSTKWATAKASIQSHLKNTSAWVMQNKMSVGIGSIFGFVCMLFAVNIISAQIAESQREKAIIAAGFELMWDEEDEIEI